MKINIALAAVKGFAEYKWFVWTGKPRTFTSKRGNSISVKSGITKIGVRAATSDSSSIRLVFESLGPTQVFSIGGPAFAKLKPFLKPTKQINTEDEIDDTGEVGEQWDAVTEKFAAAAIKLFANKSVIGTYDKGFVKWATAVSNKLRSAEKKSVSVRIKLLTQLIASFAKPQWPSERIRAQKSTEKYASAQRNNVKRMIKQLNRWVGDDDLGMLQMVFADAVDHYELACAIASGNKKWIDSARRMDTSSREEIPMAVWNWLEKD